MAAIGATGCLNSCQQRVASRGDFLSIILVFDHGVQGDDQFSHDGNECGLLGFTTANENLKGQRLS